MQPYKLVLWTGGKYSFAKEIHFISDGAAISAAQTLAQTLVEGSDECIHVMRLNNTCVATLRWSATWHAVAVEG
jgi:hypothetical protein